MILFFFDNLLIHERIISHFYHMKIPLSILFVLFYLQALSQLHLSAIFNDHMILQRDKPVKIWGAALAGENINVSIGAIKGTVRADKNGRWLISLPPFVAGGPYVLAVKTENETKVFSDVLFGEVWLCSGQSNMEFRVKQAVNAGYEMHRADNPLIRQVAIPDKLSFHPEEFIDSIQWAISTPQTTGEFTAVGYFFAKDIYERLHVPVGLIYDNWGGSQVESWISKDAMMGSDDLKEYARQIPASWEETNARIEKKLDSTLRKNGGIPDADESTVLKDNYPFAGWMPSTAPGAWDWIGLPAYRGEGFMVKEIQVDSIQRALPSTMSLGPYDSRFSWFLNGSPLPKTSDKNIIDFIASEYLEGGKKCAAARNRRTAGSRLDAGWDSWRCRSILY